MENSNNNYNFTTHDYRIIQKYMAVPLMRIGLFFLIIDFIGFALRTEMGIYWIPLMDHYNFYHGIIFMIGFSTIIACEIFIYLDTHPLDKIE